MHYTNIGKLTTELKKWGYLDSWPNPSDNRKKIYEVLYHHPETPENQPPTSGPCQRKEVGQGTNLIGEIVGQEDSQAPEFNAETNDQYIELNSINTKRQSHSHSDIFGDGRGNDPEVVVSNEITGKQGTQCSDAENDIRQIAKMLGPDQIGIDLWNRLRQDSRLLLLAKYQQGTLKDADIDHALEDGFPR